MGLEPRLFSPKAKAEFILMPPENDVKIIEGPGAAKSFSDLALK